MSRSSCTETFRDLRTIRYGCRVDPHGHLEIASNSARPELVLDRETAGRLGRWLLAFEATGTLADAGPSRDALAAAVEDHAAQIDGLRTAIQQQIAAAKQLADVMEVALGHLKQHEKAIGRHEACLQEDRRVWQRQGERLEAVEKAMDDVQWRTAVVG